jgi:hypothetical protein
MVPTAQGMVSERCGSAVISFEKTVARPFDGYEKWLQSVSAADK